MPWKSLGKFSKKLNPSQGRRAAKQANAILRSGAPEGVAIATALKHANSMKNPHRGAAKKAGRIKRLAGALQSHEREGIKEEANPAPHRGALRKAGTIRNLAGDLEQHESSRVTRARMTGQISPRAQRKHLDVDATATMQ